MKTITTVGLDIAKSVFQVHGVDTTGQVVIRRQLKRRYVPAFEYLAEERAKDPIQNGTAHRDH
jgi:transposase